MCHHPENCAEEEECAGLPSEAAPWSSPRNAGQWLVDRDGGTAGWRSAGLRDEGCREGLRLSSTGRTSETSEGHGPSPKGSPDRTSVETEVLDLPLWEPVRRSEERRVRRQP